LKLSSENFCWTHLLIGKASPATACPVTKYNIMSEQSEQYFFDTFYILAHCTCLCSHARTHTQFEESRLIFFTWKPILAGIAVPSLAMQAEFHQFQKYLFTITS
jgi:hypothetical protein